MNRNKGKNYSAPIWLNVASAQYVLPNFINLDNSIYFRFARLPAFCSAFMGSGHKQIVNAYRAAMKKATMAAHDCRRPLKFSPNSVDHILCSHFLEHVYPDEALAILADFKSVLRANGTLHIVVPNLLAMVNEYARNRTNPNAANTLVKDTLLTHSKRPSVKYRMLEFLGYEGMKHRWMYDPLSIAEAVVRVGLTLTSADGSPSAQVRSTDGEGSAHVFAIKKML